MRTAINRFGMESIMKALRVFFIVLYTMFLFAAGMSFVAEYSCKKAVTDIVVYQSEDRITDAVFEVYPDMDYDKIMSVYEFIENNSDLRRIAELYVDAALKEAASSETNSDTLEGMLNSVHSEEMQSLVSNFTVDMVEYITGKSESDRSELENRLYSVLKTALSENVTNSVSVYTADIVNDMSSQQRMLVKLYSIFTSTAAQVIFIVLTVFNALMVFASGIKRPGNISGGICALGIGTAVGGAVMLLVSRAAVSAALRLTNRILGRSITLDVQSWYTFGGVCIAAGILAIILAFIFRRKR